MGREFKSLCKRFTIIKGNEVITMNITKDAILEIIKAHPGLRGREIAEHLQVHHLNIISLLVELKAEEKIQVECRYNRINDEFYNRYYLNI